VKKVKKAAMDLQAQKGKKETKETKDSEELKGEMQTSWPSMLMSLETVIKKMTLQRLMIFQVLSSGMSQMPLVMTWRSPEMKLT
jgi:hypothetical protein